MATRKAVLITDKNVNGLLGRFELGGWEAEDLVGMYLVSGFGSTNDWDLLTKAALDKLYTSGEQLQDKTDFFEVVRK